MIKGLDKLKFLKKTKEKRAFSFHYIVLVWFVFACVRMSSISHNSALHASCIGNNIIIVIVFIVIKGKSAYLMYR